MSETKEQKIDQAQKLTDSIEYKVEILKDLTQALHIITSASNRAVEAFRIELSAEPGASNEEFKQFMKPIAETLELIHKLSADIVDV